MRFCSIASGSSGNSIYVGSDNTHILVDAGISGKRISEGLALAGLHPSELSGILITHEHSDHISGLGVMARKYHIPMYMTLGTQKAIELRHLIGRADPSLFVPVNPDEDFEIGDLKIKANRISHDAAEPVSYRIDYGNKSAAVITDLGTYTEQIVAAYQDVNVILAESNHDIKMLEMGPYPYQLKMRIKSDHGHLSNEAGGQMLSKLLHDKVEHIFLGHLSKENNFPGLALESVKCEIAQADVPYGPTDFPIEVASREMPSAIIEF